MKILVFSDSHNEIKAMVKVVESEKPDSIFHLSDHILDALELEKQVDVPVYCVAGNMDKVTEGSNEKFVSLRGKCFLLIHGHQFQQTGEVNNIFISGRKDTNKENYYV